MINPQKAHAEILASFALARFLAGLSSNDQDRSRLCARCLSAISENVPKIRSKISSLDRGLTKVANLLDAEDDTAGNASLIIANCLTDEVDPKILIPKLINLVDNSKSNKTRKNAAIALSKSASLSDTARDVFRQNHGLEILKSRMSQIKL